MAEDDARSERNAGAEDDARPEHHAGPDRAPVADDRRRVRHERSVEQIGHGPRRPIVDPDGGRPERIDRARERSVDEQRRAALRGEPRGFQEPSREQRGKVSCLGALDGHDAFGCVRTPRGNPPSVTRRERLERAPLEPDDAVPGHGFGAGAFGCIGGAAPPGAGAPGAAPPVEPFEI